MASPHPRRRRPRPSQAFCRIALLLTILIVALVVGGIKSIAISKPPGGTICSPLIQDLSLLRTALELFQIENGGAYPSAPNVTAALTAYNDGHGNLSATKSATYIYGPYLRQIPALPVGKRKGQSGIDIPANRSRANVGWIYNPTTGAITTNTTTESDPKGIPYNAY
jgi:hypothetical protein